MSEKYQLFMGLLFACAAATLLINWRPDIFGPNYSLGVFPNNCNPRVVSVDDSCGCTLTRASIRAMTPQDFEDQGLKEVGMDKIIANAKMARMTGVPESTLMDLLLSKFAPIKQINLGSRAGQSIIAPWIYGTQEHNVNANYFEIVTGVATTGAGTGSIPASAWDLTIKNSQAQFATNLANLEKYFSPGHFVAILYKDAGSGDVGRTLQFKVISAVNADSGGVNRAKLTLEPNYSAAGWAALSGGQKAVYQPTHGVVIPMANSVSNYESWCNNRPSENRMKLLVYWLQTIRETHCYNDEYLKALNAPLTSEFFKSFRELPLVKQRKIQELRAELAFYNTIFYGQRINENQSVETYQSLPTVVDPANTSCVLEYKANTLGVRQQLVDCGRVTDLQGATLDFDLLKSMLYALKRNREIESGSIETIDIMTDRFTRSNILTTMIDYYKKKYGVDTTRFYQANQTLKFDNITGLMPHDLFEFPDEGLRLAVFSHNYFDDRLAAFPSTDKTLGRAIWGIDWSDFKIGLAGAQTVQRQTNIADNLYNCIITPNVNHYNLTSKSIAVMLDNPNRHMLIENFGSACPTLTVSGCAAVGS
jgi:hypothetical protein